MTSRQSLMKRSPAAFRESLPNFHALLRKYKSKSKLMFDAEGEPDVMEGGKGIYD